MILRGIALGEKDVPLSSIRHSDRKCYVQEGHGGREIEVWPIYRFIHQYVNGDMEQAREDFADWYLDQFMKYRHVPKQLGGMRGGSLARVVEGEVVAAPVAGGRSREAGTDESYDEANARLQKAIALRVEQRLELVESIRVDGYTPNLSDPVLAIKQNHCLYLEGGHHRAAVLKALGWSVFPGVKVFRGRAHYRLWLWCRALVHGVVSRGPGKWQQGSRAGS